MGWVEGRGWPRVAMGGHGSLAIVPWMCGQCLRGGGEVIYTKRNACQGPKPRRGIERLETKPKTPPKPRTKTDQVWRRGARRWVSNVEKDKGIAPRQSQNTKTKIQAEMSASEDAPRTPGQKASPNTVGAVAPREKNTKESGRGRGQTKTQKPNRNTEALLRPKKQNTADAADRSLPPLCPCCR